MPKEKINHAPQFIEVLDDLKCPNGCEPPASCSKCPAPLSMVEIGNIAWNPVPNGEAPAAWVPDHKPVRRDAELAVGWHRDSWVQLSIEADPAYFEMASQYPDGDTEARTSVYTPPLSRDEINRLIRTLRRARDQVFGRDE